MPAVVKMGIGERPSPVSPLNHSVNAYNILHWGTAAVSLEALPIEKNLLEELIDL